MKRKIHVSAEARKVHEQAIVVDLHADTLFLVFRFGYRLERRHRNPFPRSPFCMHVDIPRMRAGGVNLIGFSLPSLSFGPGRRKGGVRKSLERVNAWARTLEDQILLVRHPDDILSARERGIPAFFLSCEGAHGISADREEMAAYRAMGLWSVTLAHLTTCSAAFSSTARRWAGRPLPKEGHALIESMESAGMIVDLAHMGERGLLDAVEACMKPPIVSHTGFHGLRAIPRNISDYAAKKIADKNGVIGVIFYPGYLSKSRFGSIDCVVAAVQYLRSVAGDDSVALGSDFDGWVPSFPDGLEDICMMPALTERLLRTGMPIDTVKKILGGNALRVMREAVEPRP